MTLYLKISIIGAYILVLIGAMFLQSLSCHAEDNSVKLSAYVVEKKGFQTINDFDFSSVNVEYPVPLALDKNLLKFNI